MILNKNRCYSTVQVNNGFEVLNINGLDLKIFLSN